MNVNKKPYLGSWYVAKTIPNGKVLQKQVYKVTDDCRYAVNYEQVQTQCNDGYVIEGSTLRVTENDGWDCVSATSDFDEDDNGLDDNYENRDDECNEDLLLDSDYPTDLTDLVGDTIVGINVDTINFLSYDQSIKEDIEYENKALDYPK